MGAALIAPFAGVGSCAASLCGGCLAAGCCKLATAGSTDTTKGARCVLFWLQVTAAVLSILLAWQPKSWLDSICNTIPDIGVCECYQGSTYQSSCYGDQLIYRTEGAVLVVYLFLLILSVSGCSKHAAKDCPAGKFLGLIVLIIVLFFVPNYIFSAFGSVAGCLSAIYLVAQTVLLMDFAYSWNEAWHSNAQTALSNINSQGYRMWLIAIVVAAAAWFILSLVECILLCISFETGGARALILITFFLAVALLVLSITEWCKHGALLTSCVVLAYLMWLAYEALTMLPYYWSSSPSIWYENLLLRRIGLGVCTVSLTAFAYSTSFSSREPAVHQASLAEQGEARTLATESHDEDVEDVPEGLDTSDFAVQCSVHAAAAIYIASALAPARSPLTFAARTAAVAVSLLLYGWTLVAPMVMKNRAF